MTYNPTHPNAAAARDKRRREALERVAKHAAEMRELADQAERDRRVAPIHAVAKALQTIGMDKRDVQ